MRVQKSGVVRGSRSACNPMVVHPSFFPATNQVAHTQGLPTGALSHFAPVAWPSLRGFVVVRTAPGASACAP